MSLSDSEARALLRRLGLRATRARLAVMQVLARADNPLSYSEVLARLGDAGWDPATTFRNLVRLREAGVAPVVSRADGIDRYALAAEDDDHRHPHFLCESCGGITCLPTELTTVALGGAWEEPIADAVVQLRGVCPGCRATSARRCSHALGSEALGSEPGDAPGRCGHAPGPPGDAPVALTEPGSDSGTG